MSSMNDEPQARKVVQYGAHSAPRTTITKAPKVKAMHTCVMCSTPVHRAGGVCRVHYYLAAVNGHGRQFHGIHRRPGLWLPPIIALVTVLSALIFLQGVAIFLCFLIPMFMWMSVFGSGRNRHQQQAPSAAAQSFGPSMGDQIMQNGRNFADRVEANRLNYQQERFQQAAMNDMRQQQWESRPPMTSTTMGPWALPDD